MRTLAAGIFLSLWALAASADDNTACTQAYLGQLGYDVGPVDGLLGPRTVAASQAYLDDNGVDLPPLAKHSVAAWCAHARSDARYRARPEIEFDGYGVLPRDVVLAALKAGAGARSRACGAVADRQLDWLERQVPVHRISGFNSRVDNLATMPGARAAEEFAGRFGAASVAAFARQDAQARTRLVRVLANWARSGAFLGTISCVRADNSLIDTGECGEWRQPDGQDLSGMKDASHSTFLMAGLVRVYLALLSDHGRDALAEEHAEIADWMTNGLSARLKRPGSVYFGLNVGWYWPSINLAMAEGRKGHAKRLLRRMAQGLARQVNRDGSIIDRTTRGDRALWYHYTSIGEVLLSLEMLRAAGLRPDPEFEERIHVAVDLFVRAVKDHSVIHPWASQRHKSSYKGETQSWNRSSWPDNDFGGTWLHIYPYRYPNHPNAAALRKMVGWNARSATTDIDFGFGPGCLYNLAAGSVSR